VSRVASKKMPSSLKKKAEEKIPIICRGN